MDTALKQRLIGAVVLVALAVIFLPMLVKGPAPDSGDGRVDVTVARKDDHRQIRLARLNGIEQFEPVHLTAVEPYVEQHQ